MVQRSQIEAYHSLKNKSDNDNLLCIIESIIGGLMLEQPKEPIKYIKKRLIDTKRIKEHDTIIHNELYAWPYHPLLSSYKSLTNNQEHEFLKHCFYYRIKFLQDKNLSLENTRENEEFENSLFSLTELYLNS
ncbi:unnamed protein product [Schistosoma turkestanicum]|nr:unnamed protein product [Schistosoma turkestanicum]